MTWQKLVAIVLVAGMLTGPASAAADSTSQQQATCPEIVDLDRSDTVDVSSYYDCKKKAFTEEQVENLESQFRGIEHWFRTKGQWLIDQPIPGSDEFGELLISAADRIDAGIESQTAAY